jgi:hypothetical protein
MSTRPSETFPTKFSDLNAYHQGLQTRLGVTLATVALAVSAAAAVARLLPAEGLGDGAEHLPIYAGAFALTLTALSAATALGLRTRGLREMLIERLNARSLSAPDAVEVDPGSNLHDALVEEIEFKHSRIRFAQATLIVGLVGLVAYAWLLLLWARWTDLIPKPFRGVYWFNRAGEMTVVIMALLWLWLHFVRGGVRDRLAFKAGAVYAVLFFAVGTALGPSRELWSAPNLGPPEWALVEALVMSAAAWLMACLATRILGVPAAPGARASMGLAALIILLALLALVVLTALMVGGLSLAEYAPTLIVAPGAISLFVVLLFAKAPALVERPRRHRPPPSGVVAREPSRATGGADAGRRARPPARVPNLGPRRADRGPPRGALGASMPGDRGRGSRGAGRTGGARQLGCWRRAGGTVIWCARARS